MNELETKEKGLLLCKNLLDNGILTEEDYNSCSQVYQPKTDGLSRAVSGTVEGLPEARTSSEISFGMSPKQGNDNLGYDLSKRPKYQAFFRLVNSSLYYRETDRYGNKINNISPRVAINEKSRNKNNNQSNNNQSDDELDNIYMTIRPDSGILNLTPMDISNTSNTEFSIFNVELRQDGNYTIQNMATKYYLRIPSTASEYQILADSTELTEECLFKQLPLNRGQYEFESVKRPGYYLSAVQDNGLIIGLSDQRSGRVWELEFLDADDSNIADTPELTVDTSAAKEIINDILTEIKTIRAKYNLIISQIEFLMGLREQIENMVSDNGPLMKYYNDLAASKTPGMNTELLDAISFSIKNEVAGRELYSIDAELDKLTLDAINIENKELVTQKGKINKIEDIIKNLIEERRSEINGLSSLLNKITTRQNSVSAREDIINKEIEYHNNTGTVIGVNSDISRQTSKYTKYEYYGLIVFIVICMICILFFSFKLYKRWVYVFM